VNPQAGKPALLAADTLDGYFGHSRAAANPFAYHSNGFF
jgi:hypothetical protein